RGRGHTRRLRDPRSQPAQPRLHEGDRQAASPRGRSDVPAGGGARGDALRGDGAEDGQRSDHRGPMSVDVVEWRPDPRSMGRWTAISLLAVVAGLIIFSLPVIARSKAFAISITPLDLLILLALATVLALLHEGIHSIAMAVFGARPRFGAVMVGGAMPA